MCQSYGLWLFYLALFVSSAYLASQLFRLWDMIHQLLSALLRLWPSAHLSESSPHQRARRQGRITHTFELMAITCLCFFGSSVASQPLTIKGDGVRVVKVDKVIIVKEDATVVQSFPVTVAAPPGAGLYFWSYPAGVTATDKGDSLEVVSASKGKLTISVKCISADVDAMGKFKGFVTKFDSITFTVGDVPPGPDPKPNPDPVIPAPLPLVGVLMIEESDDRAKISKGQYNALFGATMREWLNASVAKEDGQPALRILDKDQATLGMAKHWQDAAKKRPANFTTPWLIVSNGVTGWEGPMPADEAETKAILAKYLTAKGGR